MYRELFCWLVWVQFGSNAVNPTIFCATLTFAHRSDAYEPAISATIMEIHHSKHHATYVNNLNGALEKAEEASKTGDANTLIALAPAIKFNGGGHINHTLFWEVRRSEERQLGAKRVDGINDMASV